MTTLLYCLVLYEKYESQLDFLFPVYIIYLKNIYKWKIKLMFQTTKQFSNGSAHLRQAYVPIPGLRWVGLQFPMISSSRYDVMFQSYVTNKQKGRLYIYKNICIYKYMWLYMRVYIYIYIYDICVCVSILIFRHVSDIPKLHPISRIPKILAACPCMWISESPGCSLHKDKRDKVNKQLAKCCPDLARFHRVTAPIHCRGPPVFLKGTWNGWQIPSERISVGNHS